MNSEDIVRGAAVSDYPKFYVLGCFDKRITFYSQQVRALSLVHALHKLGYLNSAASIAIIGAGAAGLTTAAALMLATTARIVIFEKSEVLLPLQSATSRRKLDPHIYDWPGFDTPDKAANLPILDWEAGPAQEVRFDVITEFEHICLRKGQFLEKRLGHQVKSIERIGNSYKVIFDFLGNPGDALPSENRSDQFDMIFLAVGFGLEPEESIEGIRDKSYWSDAGVPTAEFAARSAPRFFVSGNGDGGLIDLVAAASADFDHGGMIRLITEHPGTKELGNILQRIDNNARLALAKGTSVNLYQEYERQVSPLIEQNGMLARVAGNLRRGVQLVFQTQQEEIFSIYTAVLNRLAVFVTIKACEISKTGSFRHIWCGSVSKLPTVVPGTILLDCQTVQIEVDEVIIRRGPMRDSVRKPFINIISKYEEEHDYWLRLHGDAILVPRLSSEARSFFWDLARTAEIPLSRRLLRQVAANLPVTFKLRANGQNVHWSGALGSKDIQALWDTERPYKIILHDDPDALGEVANAILRVACHSRNVTLYADPVHWRGFVRQIVMESLHAKGISVPPICADFPGGGTEDAREISKVRLAKELHAGLDAWMLRRIHAHLEEYFRSGSDPGRAIGLDIAQDLRQQMATIWSDWYVEFTDTAEVLKHFLCLMMCAADDDGAAQVLVGPEKLPQIIRGTVVSLAIASAWTATEPKNERPGNLRRDLGENAVWAGHSCAADLINGKSILLQAGTFMWQTDFVILAVEGTVEITRSAETAFAQANVDQPSFSEPFGCEPLVLSISVAFSRAVEAGTAALIGMLGEVEARRFDRLNNAIERGNPA
ncbi:hypothetical protein GCM10027277_34950 [Pseudoduganella ginsengisoli]|uniref:ABC-three component systems C-terminal domain-containing protein n=1 Tax=Pseudoduganella ginsengisoli TaxID=1462440 RepID=A0A6L6PY67_9BURK|nr:ABC-three component system protein [Pseudoduganella ginsengisoli]MTW02119.1 hypothetical protein [Pseudoduganella ginsengisoli]